MKYLYFTIFFLVTVYTLVLIFIYFNQRNLLYHPAENNYLDDKIEFIHEEVWIKIEKDIKLKSWLIKKDLKWIEIDYGKILLFNQCLPHGNVVNVEKETRWSLNCRFKSILTPYSDKKIGEFFEPITLRKLTQLGMKFKLPKFDD